ncbi:hypothetical protein SAMN04487905_10865 [Actinopolyspora xinjiangensis]|uniref:Uncharacterized protein n=1 Tax=Actinopolyspora xinjiangensis TaxID=405564 RepID=A0A1H0V7U6_9ACTN|nr:hypothetical protein [Actinopolyspora xinjiangensis]SDP74477.1 hypothetical protein SAMN04487905_10865 [Actinopolyspora xinjiangensis]
MSGTPARNSPFVGLHWGTIVVLGALGLIQPVLGVLRVYETLGRPWSPVVVTALVAVVWVAVVVRRREQRPVLTLAIVGTLYGVLTIALNWIVRTVRYGDPTPLPGPAIASVVLANLLGGALLGLLALLILRVMSRQGR